MKKSCLVFALVLTTKAFAFMAQPMTQQWPQFQPYPTMYQQPYMNTMNYWGQPWGMQQPVYFYPQLPFQGLMMPQYQYYFQQHTPSPYAPYYQCPTCGGNPYIPPVFPQQMIHPGGGVS